MSTVMGGPGESIEAFAALRARLVDPFAERAAVLREEGLDERALAALEATWSTRLAAGDAAAEGLAQAFGEAFSNARAKSGGSEPVARPGLADAFSGVTSAAESGAPVIEATPVAAEPPPVQPTYAQPTYAKPTFARQAPSPPAAAQQAPSPPAAAPEYTATAGIDLAAIMKKVVPFDPFAKPSVGAAAGSEEKARPPASRSPEFGGTAEVDIAAIAAAARDRFAKPKGATSGGGPVAPTVAPLATPAPAPPAPATPLVSVIVRNPPPAMSLDQYALLSAEIAIVGTDPTGRAAVFKKVGVDNPEALMAEWRARFASDPALAGRWSAAYAHHYARLRTERGGGR